jgi:NADPH-dependent curcumin reductase CurA
LIIGIVITTISWVSVTLLTKPTDAATCAEFQSKIRTSRHDIAWGLLAMTMACVSIYSAMFAVGYWIYGEVLLASITTSTFTIATLSLWPILKRLNSK